MSKKTEREMTLDKWLENIVKTKPKESWDLTPTTSNAELISQILDADIDSIQYLHKQDVVNNEFVLLEVEEGIYEGTKRLILFKAGKLFIYTTSSKVLIDALSSLPLKEARKYGHLFKIKIIEKKSKNKKNYLGVEVVEL